VAVLAPNGGDASGFILVRGTAQQIDSLRRDEEYQRLVSCVRMIVDRLGIQDAFVDEGLAQVMSQYGDEVGKL
jgi:hypothetical protein